MKRAKEIVLRAYDAGVVYPANRFERVICKVLQDEGIFSHKKYELTEKGVELAKKLRGDKIKF